MAGENGKRMGGLAVETEKGYGAISWPKYIEYLCMLLLFGVFAYFIMDEIFYVAGMAGYWQQERTWKELAVYSENPAEVVKIFWQRYGMELIIVLMVLIFSVISIVGSIVFSLCHHSNISLGYLGCGTLVAAVWNLTNPCFQEIFFNNPSGAANIFYCMTMLLPFPFLFYMDEIQRGRYWKLYSVWEIILSVEFIVFTALHFSRIRDFAESRPFIILFCILSVLPVLFTMLFDICYAHIKEYPFVAVGMAVMWIAVFVRMVSYFHRDGMRSSVILPVGLLVLLLLAFIKTQTIDGIMDK